MTFPQKKSKDFKRAKKEKRGGGAGRAGCKRLTGDQGHSTRRWGWGELPQWPPILLQCGRRPLGSRACSGGKRELPAPPPQPHAATFLRLILSSSPSNMLVFLIKIMTERNQLKISIKILGKSHALCYSNKTQPMRWLKIRVPYS